ncbi:hypothetical protein PN36_31445 [Candidatus Thiomargarita nelsonii]|uniref:2-oxoacid dehydrogenase acyltransferase catalytic domain-containing protein n=1 Tax=Candidatus Thiomargarita nelsonii TaxID=1003181 RepID=A0A4E0RMT8_9GAMM|nr:hypothetical protein PN36_31445 [Candidatus Thiomargarita nelsonii]
MKPCVFLCKLRSFTISSLGGIGGTAFTPIVNAPEVAILGVSRSKMPPVYRESEFVPRLMLPLSLSYDHRVIDGAMGARFTQYLSFILSDVRRLRYFSRFNAGALEREKHCPTVIGWTSIF